MKRGVAGGCVRTSGRGEEVLKSKLAEYAKTAKANPLLACRKDRLFMSLALTSKP
jgi:hypothetical protein